jgi:hypothetical protein
MISSGTRISEIEEYTKEKLTELHEDMVSGGVPLDIVAGTDSLSLSLVEFFLSSVDSEELAELGDIEFEIAKRDMSIKIAQVVVFACSKVINKSL